MRPRRSRVQPKRSTQHVSRWRVDDALSMGYDFGVTTLPAPLLGELICFTDIICPVCIVNIIEIKQYDIVKYQHYIFQQTYILSSNHVVYCRRCPVNYISTSTICISLNDNRTVSYHKTDTMQ
jgi:hypothetical protein